MDKTEFDSDLLSPSLAKQDDFSNFDSPWNPMKMVILAFFFGLITGGGLLAYNYKRLGMQKYFSACIIFILVLSVIMYATLAILVDMGIVDIKNQEEKRTSRLVIRIISVITTLGLAASQKQRYRLFEMGDESPGKLFGPAIVAIVAGSAITYLIVFFCFMIIGVKNG